MPDVVISVLFFAVAITMAVSAGYRACAVQSPRPPDVIALVATLGLLALSFALQAPLARHLENKLVTNLGQLLGNATTLIAACAAIAMVLYILCDAPDAGRRFRPRVVGLAGVVVAMAVLFALNPTDAQRFTSSDAPLGIIAYYLLYLVYLAAALIDLFLLVRRYARRTEERYLRWGMRMVAAACLVGLLYLVGRTANLTIGYLGLVIRETGYSVLEFFVAAVLPSCAVLLAVAGFTFRRWAPRVVAPVRALRQRRTYLVSYRRLEPLWAAVNAELPELSFPIRDSGSRPRLRLYGRIIEINDAELVAAPYLPAGLRESALQRARQEGLAVDEASALADAVALKVGLRAIRDQQSPADLQPAAGTMPPELTGLDLTREITRLELVSEAFTSSLLAEELSRRAITA